MVKPSKMTLRVQLTELNSRSRWYSSQLWQIPFAYLGISGITLGSLGNSNTLYFAVASLAMGFVGMLITLHVFAILKSEDAAIKKLQSVEEILGLGTKQKASNMKWDVVPMTIIVISATLFQLILGIVLIAK